MRIGILTYHDQLNYGGVLQAYALQTVIESMGSDVRMIDHWMSVNNKTLKGPFTDKFYTRKGFMARFKYVFVGLLGSTHWSLMLRHLKTIHFVYNRFHLTPYHFYDWAELAGKDLGLDGIVVGSDQVWNCTYCSAAPYLLEGSPIAIPAISYAASFGRCDIPRDYRSQYKEGFKRFQAISVREKEGVRLVSDVGGCAVRVADPTLLLSENSWKIFVKASPQNRKTLVCYFLAEKIESAIPFLRRFSKANDCDVRILTQPLKEFKKPIRNLKRLLSDPFGRVHLMTSADPIDFVNAFAHATYVISDSFHALMFSTIFRKNVRILAPRDEGRAAMFARIEEFAKEYTSGPVVEPDLQFALNSLIDGSPTTYNVEALDKFREYSRSWLAQSLSKLR